MSQAIQKTQKYARKVLISKTVAILIVASIAQLTLSFLVMRYLTLNQTQQDLTEFTERVTQGLTYNNGRWDTSRYTADPETPHPSGSSGFSTPLYIISADGFVIERNAPIEGFLDSSDFSHLMDFQEAQTISLVTNEQWRLLARPVTYNGKTIGVIVGALYHPERFIPAVAGSKIINTIDYLESKIDISTGVIKADRVDLRGIDYDISFEIVNNFNKVVLNNGRMPTYIDKSYIYQELEDVNEVRTIKDPVKNISYMVVKQIIYDNQQNPVGIVFAGKSIGFLNTTILKSLPYIGSLIVLTILLVIYLLRKWFQQSIEQILGFYDNIKKEKPLPSHIEFNKKEGKLIIDNSEVDIPLDSNQYYLCKTLFSNIRKRWEFDEILEQFGENAVNENWRKVYDTMNIINKKASPFLPIKLIELREKTYFINPDLQSVVKTLHSSQLT